ncbi:low specificity L-threonine aldolase, partial [Achromobacter ruhlandii]|nr:low specificity L-threonine aldolase [Achromobacter ruhlandii]
AAEAVAWRRAGGVLIRRGVELRGRVGANCRCCRRPVATMGGRLARGLRCFRGRWGPGVARLVTSFTTHEQDVDHFLAALRALVR